MQEQYHDYMRRKYRELEEEKTKEYTMLTRNEIKEILETSIVNVTFEKTDGTVREMDCTLRADLLPPVEVVEGVEKKEKKQSETNIAVWDTVAEGWRSFRIDSIKAINGTVY